MREVYVSNLRNIPFWCRNNHKQKSVLKLAELRLALQPFLNQGDEKWVEEGCVTAEDVNAFFSCHHDRVVAEEFLLSHPSVDVE